MLNCVHGAKHQDSVKLETPEQRRVDVFLKISRGFLGALVRQRLISEIRM